MNKKITQVRDPIGLGDCVKQLIIFLLLRIIVLKLIRDVKALPCPL